ncbi:sodium:proton antiporter [Kaistia algarum]|uniref:Na+/H+ antiporter subunit E n=1 Tax=Kaistia algarum TaxID=2083279 RepID=UPI000CE8FFBF|nr:Na+/H+ antiporter subunit E [Kaistia algarum]MCX5514691.1 Na+/H+ antiporter subunit E [Kaistia algarum]PPE78882.1 sodium:proton antiporter [Kaistia algarum]
MNAGPMTAWRVPWARAFALLLIWIILTRGSLKDLPVGLIAVAVAAFVSVRIRPTSQVTLRLIPTLTYVGIFLRQSVVAGFDVARRAFDPKLPLKTGFIEFSPSLPAGMERTLFADLSSMAPGTLPVEERPDGTLLVHCLDTDTDVAAQLAADEGRLAAALGREIDRG